MPPDSLEVFLGDATPLRATLYVRLPPTEPPENGRLTGVLTGPRCITSRMLPADYPLRDRGPGPTCLAEVAVPDPCYWSAELPALYDLRVEWRVGDEVRQVWQRTIGLRRFGVRGRNWSHEGKRWVLRGVSRESTTEADWPAWHAAAAVCVARALTDADGERASREGVPVVAWATQGEGQLLLAELRRLARIPAVLAVIMESTGVTAALGRQLRSAAAGLPLIEAFEGGGAPADWADALCVPAQRLATPDERLRYWAGPMLAWRSLAAPSALSVAREACDLLQRDLAPHGDFAGYIV